MPHESTNLHSNAQIYNTRFGDSVQKLCLATLLSIISCIVISSAKAETGAVELKNSPASSRGRIDILTPQGVVVAKLKGFIKPGPLFVTPDGSIIAPDPLARKIHLISTSGDSFSITRTWQLPEDLPYLIGAFPDDSGALILADGLKGIARLLPDSSLQPFSKPLTEQIPLSTAAVLPDRRILVSRSDAKDASGSVYIFNPQDSSWRPLNIETLPNEEKLIPNALTAVGNSVYLWRVGQAFAVEGTVSGDTFNPSRTFHMPPVHLLTQSSADGVISSALDGPISQLSPDGEKISSFQFFVQPISLAFLSSKQLLVVAYEHPQGESWPEIQDKIFGHQERSFDWNIFFLWTGSSAAVALVWAFLALYFSRSRPVAVPAAPQLESNHSSRPALLYLLLAMATCSLGLYLAWNAHQTLLAGADRNAWLPGYLLGAGLVALSVEVWRRCSPGSDEPNTFSKMIRTPAVQFSWFFLFPLISIGLFSTYVYSMGIERSFNGLRESVFFSGIIFALSIVLVEGIQCRKSLSRFIRQEWFFFGLPLAVGSVTFFYRLVAVPYNGHFDFTLNSFFAGQFLRGVVEGGWDWGYVPGPVLGTLPEMLGLLLGGFSPLGYRLGNSLFNLTGIFAVYLLGRTYRNPRVGCWAAVALAGNIPFIHFGRLQSNGAAATTALWALALFAVALKQKRISLWVLVGLASGYSFYEWPVARVGFTAVGCAYALILLRYPLTQIRQAPQLLGGLLSFLLMISPLIIMWEVYPQRFMPRAGAAIDGIMWEGGWLRAAAEHPTLQLLYRSFGWLFSEVDRSSQGSLSPGFNSIEAVLFACGCLILLVEGFSFNVILGISLLIPFLVCGAWSIGPPWYTRLLPTVPMACVLVARALEGLHNLLFGRKVLFWGVFGVLTCLLIVVSPYQNFDRYVDHETHRSGTRYLPHPMVAIGRKLHQVGPEPSYVLLASGERMWRLRDLAHFGVMLPYIHDLRIKESYDLEEELSVSSGTSKAFIVQLKRRDADLPVILKSYPKALVESIKDLNGDPVALLVMVRVP